VRRIERYDVSTIEQPTRADLERLARRRLDARRRGCELELTGVGDKLRLLLALTGLDEVLVIGGEEPAGLVAEPEG
jgi:anti-anti-sigma regulatory factor